MKVAKRFLIVLVLFLLMPAVFLIRHFLDLGDQYSALTYFRASVTQLFPHSSIGVSSDAGFRIGDKILVMARTESENTDWVVRDLPSVVTTLRMA